MEIKRRHKILIGVLVFIVIGLVFYSRSKTSTEQYITAKAEKGTLRQIVSATGAVMSPSEIELNTLITGEIAEINIKVGEEVKKDQILCKLDANDLEIKVQEAEASLQAAQADLSKLLQGAKDEDVAVSVINLQKAEKDYNNYLLTLENIKKQAEQDIVTAENNLKNVQDKADKDIAKYEDLVDSAEVALDDAKKSLNNTKNTYSLAIDNAKEDSFTAIETKMFVAQASLNVVYEIMNDFDIRYSLGVTDIRYLQEMEENYDISIVAITDARENLETAEESNDSEDIKLALTKANEALNETFNTLLSCYDALLHSITTIELTETELTAHKTNIKTEQTNISTALTSIQTAKQTLNDAILDYDSAVDTAESTVNTAENSLNSAKANLALTKTTYDTQILAAQDNLESTKIASEKKVNDAQTAADSYYNQWKLMEKQLDLKKSSPLSAEILLYQSRVKQSEAGLATAQKNLEKSILRAPMDGIITKKNYEVGETNSLTMPIFLMISLNKYEVEVDIPESDIVKIKEGQTVISTMDAYDEDIKFYGEVAFIEPAETIIQDVVYYKVKIALEETEYAVKSGMTANVDIETAKKEDVLLVPQRAIISSNGDKQVRILIQGEINNKNVILGLRGEEGMVEIMSGLKEGEEIVVYEKK